MTLGSPDFLGDTEQLREEIRAAGNMSPRTGPQDATDATGSIRVVADASGHVIDVTFSPRLRKRLGADQTPQALFDAYLAAVTKAINVVALTIGTTKQQPAQPSGYGENHGERQDHIQSAKPTGPTDDEADWPTATRQALDEIDASLTQLAPADAVALDRARRIRVLRSPAGRFTAKVQGNGIVGITGDPRRIATATPGALRRDAMALLSSVHQTHVH